LSLTLKKNTDYGSREEHRLRVFEDRVLRRVFEDERDGVE
jgi:hypothetical protein